MVSDSYIRRVVPTGSGQTGYQQKINIISIGRNKGVPTSDMPVPGAASTSRQLVPLSGQREDLQVTVEIKTETVNVASDVSDAEVITDHGTVINTVKEQYEFLYDNVASPNISAKYKLYVDWLDTTFEGYAVFNSNVFAESFTGSILIQIEFKVGGNFLSLGT